MKKDASGTRYRFLGLIQECEVHAKRILQAQSKAETLFPLTPAAYSALSDDTVEHINQLVYRFTKLQDALGVKLFPLIVSVLREDAKTLTIYDVLIAADLDFCIPNSFHCFLMVFIKNTIMVFSVESK